MAAYIRQRPASWFWLVGIAITIWGVAGCAAWIAARSGLGLAPSSPPGIAFALAAGSVLGGGIALLNKKLIAQALFCVALLAAAGELAWLFAGRGVPMDQGMLAAVVFAAAAGLIWFAGYSRRHGWIS